MDLKYFEEHICEELEGARDYIVRAIELKGMDKRWADIFYKMSLEEVGHAKQMFALYEEYVKILSDNLVRRPEYISESMETMIDTYSASLSEITIMQNIYKE